MMKLARHNQDESMDRGSHRCRLQVERCRLIAGRSGHLQHSTCNLQPGISDAFRFRMVTALVVSLAAVVMAQSPALLGPANRLKVPEFYPAPNQKQFKSLVQSATAEPINEDEVRATQVRVETFKEDGTLESVVEAPECIYNFKSRSIHSAGPIEAHTGDGRMRIQGEGFQLTLTNKSLTISNNVRTVIRDLGDKPLKP